MINLRSLKLTLVLATLLSGSSFTLPVCAEQPVRDYAPSDALSDILPKYKAAADANNYNEALAILDANASKMAPGSYDLAMLSQMKAQTLLQKGDFPQAIAPLEKALTLSDAATPTFFDEKQTTTLVLFLAQLYFQEAMQAKNPTLIAAHYDKTSKYVSRWKAMVKTPTYEHQLFYIRFLYSKATLNFDHPDMDLIKQALAETEQALLMNTRPKDELYLLKFVCLQQFNNKNAESAEILELLIKSKPESLSYWQQLVSLYLSTDQTTRAILTFERAQANGLMNDPKDNYNLVGLLFNIGQFNKAAELLESGLAQGKIENTLDNWGLLALCYQQLNRPFKSIDALKTATKAFPNSGQLEFMIAQAYQTLDQPENALKHAIAADTKGQLTKSKPHQVHFFAAYMAYELKQYDVALKYAQKAASAPDGARDGQNMIKAIEDIIQAREAKKKQM